MAKMKSMEEAKDRVITILNSLECLRLDQVEAINYHNVVSTGVAKQLVSDRKAFYSKDKDRILKYPFIKPNKAVTNCFDVVLKFLMNIDIKNIYKPCGATDVGFTRAKKNFELVNIRDKKELDKKVMDIEKEYAQRSESCYDSTKYVFCVANESMVDYMPKDVNFHYAFAVVNWYTTKGKLETPDIYFLTPDEELEELIGEETDDE